MSQGVQTFKTVIDCSRYVRWPLYQQCGLKEHEGTNNEKCELWVFNNDCKVSKHFKNHIRGLKSI